MESAAVSCPAVALSAMSARSGASGKLSSEYWRPSKARRLPFGTSSVSADSHGPPVRMAETTFGKSNWYPMASMPMRMFAPRLLSLMPMANVIRGTAHIHLKSGPCVTCPATTLLLVVT